MSTPILGYRKHQNPLMEGSERQKCDIAQHVVTYNHRLLCANTLHFFLDSTYHISSPEVNPFVSHIHVYNMNKSTVDVPYLLKCVCVRMKYTFVSFTHTHKKYVSIGCKKQTKPEAKKQKRRKRIALRHIEKYLKTKFLPFPFPPSNCQMCANIIHSLPFSFFSFHSSFLRCVRPKALKHHIPVVPLP